MSIEGERGEWPSTELPKTWEWLDFSEFWIDHTDASRKVPEKSYASEGALAVVDQGANLVGGFTDDLSKKSPAPLPAIVFGDHTRIVKYIDHPFAQGADGVRVFCAAPFVDARFAYHALNCVHLPDKGYSRHFKFLKVTPFPLAPLPEQHRIVAKIDGLSAKSRRARGHLDHVPRLVEKYKQAILAAAFRGELTRVWRAADAIEPRTVPLRELCASITDGDHQAPPRAATGVPFITISAMNDGTIDLNEATRFVPQSYFEGLKPSRRPSVGDVLYSVTGSFGVPAFVDFDGAFVFQRHIAILKPDRQKVDPRFLYRLLAAPQIMEQAMAVATGTAQMTVPLSGLRDFLFPNPPLDEQREINRRIESAFTWIERLASDATRACKLIDNLDQAVLAKAFGGELVPQDPNDEPASVLLERIRAERTTAAPIKRGGKGRRKTAPPILLPPKGRKK